jgi:hypothetical protein
MRRNYLMMHLALAAGILLAVPSVAEAPEDEAMLGQFSEAYQAITALGKAQNLSGLERMADDITETWQPRSMEYYGKLITYVCGVIGRDLREIPSEVRVQHVRKLALRALETYDPRKDDNISIESHYRLVADVQGGSYAKGSLTDEEWAAERRAKAKRWMVPWDRTEAALDLHFDENKDLPVLSVTPPSGTGLPTGVSPDAIRDPALRAEYKQAIEENRRRAGYRREQRRLRDLKRVFTPSVIRFFREAYAIPPYDDAELEEFLSRHIAEPELREQILDAVAEKRGVNEYIRELEARNEELNRE